MKKGKMLSAAILLATAKHDGQFDRGGSPYILHTLTVMQYLDTDDEELQCIAILHDIIEDCSVTPQMLRDKGFTERIIIGVIAMTKIDGETSDEYLARLLLCIDACKVKRCDLRHNSDIRRLKGLSDKDFQRMMKYQRMYVTITEYLETLK
jgi:guanosine-3',5'-bis(diphosphate) 3'-pyrophosphohydrolase